MYTNIGKDGFNNRHALGIDLSALFSIYLFNHLFGEINALSTGRYHEILPLGRFIVEATAPGFAACTAFLICNVSSIDVSSVHASFAVKIQNLALRTYILVGLFLIRKIIQSEFLLPFGSMAFLAGKSRISGSELIVRDISIQTLLFACLHIGRTMIITVRREGLFLEVILPKSDLLHVLFGPLNHRPNMVMILTISKSLSMNNDLMFFVRQSLPIVSLDGPVGSCHFGGFIVRDITLDLPAFAPYLRTVLC